MVWRRVLIPASTTLRCRNGVLQGAMGWEGIHLFFFDIYAVRYGSFELHAANPMDIMIGFLEDVVAADAPDRQQVSDFMSDDVEAAMARIAARKPFVERKFSRGDVNKRFRAGDHRDLMRRGRGVQKGPF